MLELANCCCCLSGRRGEREEKEREKKKREKKQKEKQRQPAPSTLPSPPKKRKTRERKFGGTNQISFFREIFLSQGEREREREREGEIHLSLHATFINTLVTEEIYKARTKCNRSPHPTAFLRRARSAPSDLRTL